jgi:hypothetical protein
MKQKLLVRIISSPSLGVKNNLLIKKKKNNSCFMSWPELFYLWSQYVLLKSNFFFLTLATSKSYATTNYSS